MDHAGAPHDARQPLGSRSPRALWPHERQPGVHDVSHAKNVSIVIGIATLLTATMTCWRMAIIKVIPLAIHRAPPKAPPR